MSVPSASQNRSSSAGSTTRAAPHAEFIDEFLKPKGEIRQFIAHASGEELLEVISYLHCGRAKLNPAVEKAYDAMKKRVVENTSKNDCPRAMASLNAAFCRAVLDAGKIDPLLTKRLRDVIESANSFEEKIDMVNEITGINSSCDLSVELASQLPVNERIEAIRPILEGNELSAEYRQIRRKLVAYPDITRVNFLNSESMRMFGELMASRIAGTVSSQFAKSLSEEIYAGSHLNKITDLLEREMTTYQRQVNDAADVSSGSGFSVPLFAEDDDRDDLQKIFDSPGNRDPKPDQRNSNSSAAPNLTTTTQATTTTTTTSTVPITVTAPISRGTTTTTTTTTNNNNTTTTPSTPRGARSRPVNAAMVTDPLNKKSGEEILVAFGYPLSLQKQHSKKWKEAAKLVQKFYKEYPPQPGSRREHLMRTATGSLKDSIDSLKVISILHVSQHEQAKKLAFEKNIAPGADTTLGKAIIGRSRSYAQRHLELLSEGSPVSTCATVAMLRPDGVIVTPKVACIASPALGKNGAELAAYLQPDGHLDLTHYQLARKVISTQITESILSVGTSHRVILSAVGIGEFIAGLSTEDAAAATKIAAKAMATLIADLTEEGISVVYTDKDDQGAFWKEVNALRTAPVAFVGALPGNWVGDNDLVINSTSNFYHPGHGGKAGKSLDGQFGDTLLFDAHVLKSIFHSVGLESEHLG